MGQEAKFAYQSGRCNDETVSRGEMSGVKAEIRECDDELWLSGSLDEGHITLLKYFPGCISKDVPLGSCHKYQWNEPIERRAGLSIMIGQTETEWENSNCP